MIQFIHRPNGALTMQLCLSAFFSAAILCLWLCGQAQSIVFADSILDSRKWHLHEVAAQAALKQASECTSKALSSANEECKPASLMEKAAREYGQMEVLLSGEKGHIDEVVIVANGFLRSGAPSRAIELLLNRPETPKDPLLSHLLADALFAIGDYSNAAMAYKLWIDTGCGGYLYSMQSNAVWIVPSKGNRCAHLPAVMRSRLEMLQDTTRGEPANLPESNSPTGNFVAH